MDVIPPKIYWAVVATVVVGLAIYHICKWLGSKDPDSDSDSDDGGGGGRGGGGHRSLSKRETMRLCEESEEIRTIVRRIAKDGTVEETITETRRTKHYAS